MRKWAAVAVMLAVLGTATAHAAVTNKPVAADKAFVTRSNDFGLNLLRKLAPARSSKNVFISPASLEFALAMTYNGASGTTQRAMANALSLEGLSLDSVNKSNQALLGRLRSSKGITLNVANAIWARKGYNFLSSFMDRVRHYYSAEIEAADFSQTTVKRINFWVANRTGDKIKSIIRELKPLDVMVLVNAVYFKGMWAAKFDKAETHDGQFTLAGGKKVSVPMMNRHGSYKYDRTTQLTAVKLPYVDDAASMVILMPSSPSGLPKLLAGLNAAKLNNIISDMHPDEMDLAIPKFRLEYEAVGSLMSALSSMGMGVAFGKGADFSKMSGNQNLYISRVAHKTFVDVNEEGTEAAAATSVVITIKAARIPLRIAIDHPFLCLIRDNQTGAVLFMGTIYDPAGK